MPNEWRQYEGLYRVLVMSCFILAAAAMVSSSSASTSTTAPPHIVFVMADDLGSADVGWNDATVLTPEMDDLATTGVVLSTCYTWSWCAPSRGAFLSGRYAPNTGFEGAGGGGGKKGGKVRVFPTEQPLLPAALKASNYTTLMVGKWHIGYARTEDTPEGRGFDTFLGYFEGGEDYYDHTLGAACGRHDVHDLWFAPNSSSSSSSGRGRPAVKPARSGTYSTELYADFVVQHIEAHDASASPLFVYAAFQGVHFPLQVPQRYFDRYASQGAGSGDCVWTKQSHTSLGRMNGFACDPNAAYPTLGKVGIACLCNRLLVKAQVSALSEAVGNITAALKRQGMWENTILIFQGDNGGPVDGAHSNTPLRGGKLNFFEGGIRPAAFVHSPLLPPAVAGTTYRGIVHEVDWYATLIALAGAPAPPLLDGVNVWPTLVDPTKPHRTEALISDRILRVGKWKLVTGASSRAGRTGWCTGELKGGMLGTGGGWITPPLNKTNMIPGDIYTTGGKTDLLGCPEDAPAKTQFPVSDPVDLWLCSAACTDLTPCLWDVSEGGDPYEREEVAAKNPDVVKTMLARLHELQAGFAANATSGTLVDNGKFCEVLLATEVKGFGVFVGPWM
tara:strand:- start:267 stop:2114 length:1848 start_codon:yes stop_codon:yes gene_type:complete